MDDINEEIDAIKLLIAEVLDKYALATGEDMDTVSIPVIYALIETAVFATNDERYLHEVFNEQIFQRFHASKWLTDEELLEARPSMH